MPDLHDEIIESEVLLLKNYHLGSDSRSRKDAKQGETEECKLFKNERKKTMQTKLVIGGTVTKGSL